MWPWRKKHATATPLEILTGHIADRTNRIVELLTTAKPPPPERPPFVCVLVEGEYDATGPGDEVPRWLPTTVGGTGKRIGGGIECELRSNHSLRNCRVTVFADLERVNIHGIFCGTDLVTAALGTCPVAFFERWELGTLVRVQCVEHAPAT